MSLIKQVERLRQLNELIRSKKSGPPLELAEKLGISRRQLYNILEDLKGHQIPIEYSRRMRSFYYANERFTLEIKMEFAAEPGAAMS